MEIDIDKRRVDPNGFERRTEPFFAIRLYPDTNEEMAALEWMLEDFTPTTVERIGMADRLQYAIFFKPKART